MHANYQKMSLTKSSQNVTKSPCFTPPVATHQLGSEKFTAYPSWTPRLCHPLPIQNPTFKIRHRATPRPPSPIGTPMSPSAPNIQNPTFKIHHRATPRPPSPATPSTAPKALSAAQLSSPVCPPGKSARKTTTKPALSSSESPAPSNFSLLLIIPE